MLPTDIRHMEKRSSIELLSKFLRCSRLLTWLLRWTFCCDRPHEVPICLQFLLFPYPPGCWRCNFHLVWQIRIAAALSRVFGMYRQYFWHAQFDLKVLVWRVLLLLNVLNQPIYWCADCIIACECVWVQFLYNTLMVAIQHTSVSFFCASFIRQPSLGLARVPELKSTISLSFWRKSKHRSRRTSIWSTYLSNLTRTSSGTGIRMWTIALQLYSMLLNLNRFNNSSSGTETHSPPSPAYLMYALASLRRITIFAPMMRCVRLKKCLLYTRLLLVS